MRSLVVCLTFLLLGSPISTARAWQVKETGHANIHSPGFPVAKAPRSLRPRVPIEQAPHPESFASESEDSDKVAFGVYPPSRNLLDPGPAPDLGHHGSADPLDRPHQARPLSRLRC